MVQFSIIDGSQGSWLISSKQGGTLLVDLFSVAFVDCLGHVHREDVPPWAGPFYVITR